MIVEQYEQRTAQWYAGRTGCITMSAAKKLLTGGGGKTRLSYLLEVAAERITGQPTEGFKSWSMQRGIDLEPFAFRAYCLETDLAMEHIGLGYLDDNRQVSFSPDGLLLNGDGTCDGGVEIKCVQQRAHVRYLDGDGGESEHQAQCQGGMWIANAPWWDLVSFCPEFVAAPLLITRIHRDPAMIGRLAMSAMKGLTEIDAMVAAIRRQRVSPGTLDICTEALQHLDHLGNDGEVELEEAS